MPPVDFPDHDGDKIPTELKEVIGSLLANDVEQRMGLEEALEKLLALDRKKKVE